DLWPLVAPSPRDNALFGGVLRQAPRNERVFGFSKILRLTSAAVHRREGAQPLAPPPNTGRPMADSDKRNHPRAKVLSMTVRYKSATVDEFVEHHSDNVSRGGIFIKTAQPFPPGTLL